MSERRYPLVIYHRECDDGFGAAWAIWAMYPDWEFHAGAYVEPPPDVAGRDVFLVDFSYKRPVLEAMAREARQITIIDHHESAQRDLEAPFEGPGLCPVETVFDMSHSGAMLTWRYFWPGESPPDLLRYIEDRDLWRKQLSGCDAVVFALRSYPQDFETWDSLMEARIEDLIFAGTPIERWFRVQVEAQVQRWRAGPRFAQIGGFWVPVANTTVQFSSELAQSLAREDGGHPFGAVFWHVRDGVTYSLRSCEKDGVQVNVARVAEGYGGGGHAGAAGFRVPYFVPMVGRGPREAEVADG